MVNAVLMEYSAYEVYYASISFPCIFQACRGGTFPLFQLLFLTYMYQSHLLRRRMSHLNLLIHITMCIGTKQSLYIDNFKGTKVK